MFVAEIALTAIASGSPFTFSSANVISTNDNVVLTDDKDGVNILNPGWYKVRLMATSVAPASTTSAGAVLSLNGEDVDSANVTVTTAATETSTYYIEYPVHVVSAPSGQTALVQFNATAAETPSSGYIFVDRME